MNVKDIPLPDAWPDLVRKAMLHVASLTRWDMIYVVPPEKTNRLVFIESRPPAPAGWQGKFASAAVHG